MARPRCTLTVAAALTCVLSAPVGAGTVVTSPLGRAPAGALQEGFLTFGALPPSSSQIDDLRQLGLRAQGMKRLPLALVSGSATQIATAVQTTDAVRFYPDEPIVFASAESNHATGIDAVHRLGLTGKGMQIAIVDTGIDATHPDLADHVKHNVKVLGPEDAKLPAGSPPGALFVPMDEGPLSDTDEYGHGTLVAGVAASDGTTGPTHVGTAPDADLIGYSVGGYAGMRSAITAFDHILDHPEWGIDVVNNSWGSPKLAVFDPASPLNVATKALADKGMVVVFPAGNSGYNDTELTLSPYGATPWTISVASSTVGGKRSEFSSSGPVVDNSAAVAPHGGHVRFTGDRLGLYHPTVTAPGSDIESSCATADAAAAGGCTPGGTASASGTSFSAPHVAGLAALLRQARPTLSGPDVRRVLEATAVPTAEDDDLWQVGYGIVDAPAALALVRDRHFAAALARAHRAARSRVLGARDWRVRSSDLWTWPQPAVSVGQTVERHELVLSVAAGADALKVGIAAYDPTATTGEHVVIIRDAGGREVGRTAYAHSGSPGRDVVRAGTALLDLRRGRPAYGRWTLTVESTLVVSDEGSSNLGHVLVQAALLTAQHRAKPPGHRFVADGSLRLAFTPDPSRGGGVRSPEGCEIEADSVRGSLTRSARSQACHAGSTKGRPAEFTSAPFTRSLVLGGSTTLVLYTTAHPLDLGTFAGDFTYELVEVTSSGKARVLDARQLTTRHTGRCTVVVPLPTSRVARASRLMVRIAQGGYEVSAGLFLFGGEVYGDAGITLTTGHIEGDG